MDPFVAQLADICKEHPTRAKWVFVPTHSIGRTIGDRLVLAGTDWANLRFVTPFEIALRMGAPRASVGGQACQVRLAVRPRQGALLLELRGAAEL